MTTARVFSKKLTVAALSTLAFGAATAQAGRVTLYEGQDFQGHYIATDNSMAIVGSPALAFGGSSVIVSEGVWEACAGANFRGRCAQFPPGQYPRVDQILNGSIASLRQVDFATSARQAVILNPQPVVVNPPQVLVGTTPVIVNPQQATTAYVVAAPQSVVVSPAPAVVNPPATVVVNPPPQVVVAPAPTGRAVLYEYPNFGGGWAVVERGPAKDLDWANFSYGHRATSVRVESGTWLFCSEMAFRGECRTLGPGEYPQLSGALGGGVASARQVWQPEVGAFNMNTR